MLQRVTVKKVLSVTPQIRMNTEFEGLVLQSYSKTVYKNKKILKKKIYKVCKSTVTSVTPVTSRMNTAFAAVHILKILCSVCSNVQCRRAVGKTLTYMNMYAIMYIIKYMRGVRYDKYQCDKFQKTHF